MNFGPILFWVCAAILLGVIMYPIIQFARSKNRTLLGWLGTLLAAALTVMFAYSLLEGSAQERLPVFLRMIGECFLGIDDVRLEC